MWQIYYEGDEVVMAQNIEENVMEHNDIGKLCEERCKTEVEESMPETSTAFKGASDRLHQGIKVILSVNIVLDRYVYIYVYIYICMYMGCMHSSMECERSVK